MIDNSRIRTGHDLEILLGGDYFLTILQGAYDAGEIPSEIRVNNDMTIRVNKPTHVKILAESTVADIKVTIPIRVIDDMDIVVAMKVEIKDSKISYEYRSLDSSTVTLIMILGAASGDPNLLDTVESELRNSLNRDIALDLVASDVAKMKVRKISASDDCQAAFGLYLNLNLKIASQSKPPEEEYIPRGDVSKAISFLPSDRSFAVGVGKPTFPRFANNMWHDFGVKSTIQIPMTNQTMEVISHPVKDGKETVGKYKRVSIALHNGALRVTVTSEITIDYWPDADVTAKFDFIPYIDNKKLKFDIKLVDFDADTGLLGDLLSFLVGGLLGGLIGLLFGPVGFVIGASIGGVGGIATIEITEEILEGVFSDKVVEEAEKAGVASAFSAFPVKKKIFADKRDPFFIKHYLVVNQFLDSKVDSSGMSFSGNAVMGTENEPKDTRIIDVKRSDSQNSWEGIESLTYVLDGIGAIVVPIEEVLRRSYRNQILNVGMAPIAIRRKKSIVTEIKFNTGVIFLVNESVKLQDNYVLHVEGFKLIHPKNANPYYRAKADKNTGNNFESLPKF